MNRRETRREARKAARRGEQVTNKGKREYQEVVLAKPVVPQNQFQSELLNAIKTKQVVFTDAPAGCGKTYVITTTVIDALKSGKIQKIILSRPAVGMGNSLGLLPGGLREKFEPYLMPIVDVITQRYGKGFYECQIGNGNIEFVPLEYLRGRSFNDAIVIVDEFQNTTPDEAYSIMTRLGETSQMFCMGDTNQHDMRGESGLEWATDFIDKHNLFEFAALVDGESDDIVRSGFCKAIVKAMESEKS